MGCWIAFVCGLAAAGPTLFHERAPAAILRRVQVCETRTCCLYQATLRRMPENVPDDSGELEAIVLRIFTENRTAIELTCPKV